MSTDTERLNATVLNLTQRYPNSVALAKRRKTLPKYLISDQMQALLRSITDPRDRAIFRVSFHHGLRASEVGLIQMRDYRPGKTASDDYLYIERLKGSLGGNTPLVPEAAKAVRAWIKKRGWAAGPMFLSKRKTPISRYQLHRLMQRYCEKAGIPGDKAHFHTLKHTCATVMISDFKESILDVKNHLGHADIRSTMIYAALTEAANEERSRRLKNWK